MEKDRVSSEDEMAVAKAMVKFSARRVDHEQVKFSWEQEKEEMEKRRDSLYGQNLLLKQQLLQEQKQQLQLRQQNEQQQQQIQQQREQMEQNLKQNSVGQQSPRQLNQGEDERMDEDDPSWMKASGRMVSKRKLEEDVNKERAKKIDNRYKVLDNDKYISDEVDFSDNSIKITQNNLNCNSDELNLGSVNNSNDKNEKQVYGKDSNPHKGSPSLDKGGKNVNANMNNRQTRNDGSSNASEGVKFLPPIVTVSKNWKLIENSLRARNTTYNTRILSRNKIKINIAEKDKEIWEGIMDDFKLANWPAYTYTPKGDKPVTILLKGVHWNYESEHVKNEFLKAFPDLNLIEVERFTTKRSIEGNYKLGIFRIVLQPGTDLKEVIRTKYFMNFVVSWERPKISGPVQCKRCQEIGHLAKNCSQQYRCVKCAEEHGPGNCKLEKEDQTFCVNCKQVGHPANYRGCPYFQKYVKDKELRKNSKKNEEKGFNMFLGSRSGIKTGISYADALRNSDVRRGSSPYRSNFGENKANAFDRLEDLTQQLFGRDIAEMFISVEKFLSKVSGLPVMQKKIELIKFIASLGGYGNV